VAGDVDNNYSFIYVSGTPTINKAPLTADADDQTKIYGQAQSGFDYYLHRFCQRRQCREHHPARGKHNSHHGEQCWRIPDHLDGGSATNYTLPLQPGTLTITKAPLTAKADDQTKVYTLSLSLGTLVRENKL